MDLCWFCRETREARISSANLMVLFLIVQLLLSESSLTLHANRYHYHRSMTSSIYRRNVCAQWKLRHLPTMTKKPSELLDRSSTMMNCQTPMHTPMRTISAMTSTEDSRYFSREERLGPHGDTMDTDHFSTFFSTFRSSKLHVIDPMEHFNSFIDSLFLTKRTLSLRSTNSYYLQLITTNRVLLAMKYSEPFPIDLYLFTHRFYTYFRDICCLYSYKFDTPQNSIDYYKYIQM